MSVHANDVGYRKDFSVDLSRDKTSSREASILDAIASNVTQGILLVDAFGDVVFLNPRAIALLDIPEKFHEPPYRFSDFVKYQIEAGEFSEGNARVPTNVQASINAGDAFAESLETRLHYERTRPNGVTLEVQTTPIRDGGFVRTFADVSRWKRLEEELKSSARSLRALASIAEMTTNHVIVTGTDRRITWVNQAALDVAGGRREDVIGRTVPEVFHCVGSVANDGTELIADVMRGQRVRIEHARRHCDGRTLWVIEDIAPLLGDTGQIESIVSVAVDISDRRSMEQRLREREELLENMSEMSGVGAWEVDLQTGVATWSAQTCRIHDVPVGTKPSLDTAIRYYEEHARPTVTRVITEAIRDGRTWEFKLPLTTAKGRHRWVRATGRPIYEDGVATRLHGAFQDVTEEHESRERLERSEADARRLAAQSQQLAHVVEMTATQVYITNIDNKIIWANEALCRFVDLDYGDLVGRTPSELFRQVKLGGGDDLSGDARATALSGASANFEEARIDHSGRCIWVSGTMSPMRDYHDEIIGIASVAVDITERRNAERRMDEIANLLDDMSEIAGIGAWEVDLRSGQSTWSREMRRLHGITEAEVPDYPQFIDIYQPDSRAVLRGACAEAVSLGTPWDVELSYELSDGALRTIRSRGRVERADGVPVRLVGSCQDITERKVREIALARYAGDLEQYAYVASHDLQEPLRKITTHARLLSMAVAENDRLEIDRCLSVMTASATRGRNLVSDLLKYAKLRDQAVERTSVNVAGLITNVVAQVSDDPNARIDMRPIDGDLCVLCDASLITQVLQNLLSNAIKYRKLCSAAEISVDVNPGDGDGMRISVSDQGIGFDMSYAELIFQPFKRLVTKGEYSGSGIGLSLVRSIVEKHGWTIKVQSMPGVGSTFVVEIPRRDIVHRPIATDAVA